MRRFALIAAFCGLIAVAVVSAQQPTTQYLTTITLLSGSGTSLVRLSDVQLRTRAGTPGTLTLDPWIHIQVTPEAIDGKVLLHVTAASQAQSTAAGLKFDLLAGPGVRTPVIALRTDSGAWLPDKDGRPLYLQLQSEVVQR